MLFSCSNAKHGSCPAVYKSPEGYKEVIKAYNSVLDMWPVPCESTFIKTSYGQTHVITWGNKRNPPLLLFHGGGNCALMWVFIAEQLAQHRYVIAPDTNGDVGLSIPARPFRNTHDYADWFAELVHNLGFSKVDIAGISWGGGIALQCALRYPDRINRMVLMCPAWGIEMFRIWALVYHSLPAALFPDPDRVRSLLEWLSVKRPVFADSQGDAIVNYLVVALGNYKSPASVEPVVFSDEELRTIGIPVYLLIGDREVIYSDPGAVIRRAKATMVNIKHTTIAHAGHALFYDQPDDVSREINRFLQ
jgi:pimeloyl-ACP methyl ester carboxylesterase